MSYRLLIPILALSISPTWASITISDVDPTRGLYVDYQEFGARFNSFAGVVLGFIDITQPIDLFSANLYLTAPRGFYNENQVAPLTEGGQQRISWLYAFQLAGANTPTLGAALQLAIWDIMADGGDGPGHGILQAGTATPQAVIDAWQSYLNVSSGQASTAASYYIVRSRIDGSILGTYVGAATGSGPDINPPPPGGGDVTGVPEPSSLTTLLVLMTIGLGIKLRK